MRGCYTRIIYVLVAYIYMCTVAVCMLLYLSEFLSVLLTSLFISYILHTAILVCNYIVQFCLAAEQQPYLLQSPMMYVTLSLVS
jgi:hypothetical protein